MSCRCGDLISLQDLFDGSETYLDIHQSAQLQFVWFCRIELASRCSICNHQIEINWLLRCEQTCFKDRLAVEVRREISIDKKKSSFMFASLWNLRRRLRLTIDSACLFNKKVSRANLSSTRLNSSNCQSQWIESQQTLFDLDQRRLVLSCCCSVCTLIYYFGFPRMGDLYGIYVTWKMVWQSSVFVGAKFCCGAYSHRIRNFIALAFTAQAPSKNIFMLTLTRAA